MNDPETAGWGLEPEPAPGPGARLRPLRRHEVLHRMLYSIEHEGARYTVEMDQNKDWSAVLYLDGRRREERELPASFAVPGGAIEVDASLYGVRRVHLVLAGGRQVRLQPDSGTLEDLRWRLHRRHRGLSRLIAWTAVVILACNLVLAVPQALELVTEVPRIAERFGTFTSPVGLPGWLNTMLVVGGAAAAVERVLMLRRNRLLDAETIWMEA